MRQGCAGFTHFPSMRLWVPNLLAEPAGQIGSGSEIDGSASGNAVPMSLFRWSQRMFQYLRLGEILLLTTGKVIPYLGGSATQNLLCFSE